VVVIHVPLFITKDTAYRYVAACVGALVALLLDGLLNLFPSHSVAALNLTPVAFELVLFWVVFLPLQDTGTIGLGIGTCPYLFAFTVAGLALAGRVSRAAVSGILLGAGMSAGKAAFVRYDFHGSFRIAQLDYCCQYQNSFRINTL